jgi:hypothetical protein
VIKKERKKAQIHPVNMGIYIYERKIASHLSLQIQLDHLIFIPGSDVIISSRNVVSTRMNK